MDRNIPQPRLRRRPWRKSPGKSPYFAIQRRGAGHWKFLSWRTLSGLLVRVVLFKRDFQVSFRLLVVCWRVFFVVNSLVEVLSCQGNWNKSTMNCFYQPANLSDQKAIKHSDLLHARLCCGPHQKFNWCRIPKECKRVRRQEFPIKLAPSNLQYGILKETSICWFSVVRVFACWFVCFYIYWVVCVFACAGASYQGKGVTQLHSESSTSNHNGGETAFRLAYRRKTRKIAQRRRTWSGSVWFKLTPPLCLDLCLVPKHALYGHGCNECR